jgi:putative glutamine amidotransferase
MGCGERLRFETVAGRVRRARRGAAHILSWMDRARPLIAVPAYRLEPDRVARWPQGGYGVPAPYLDALRRADARTAVLSPGEVAEADDLLGPFDGLLLIGGGDVDPTRYGGELGAHDYAIDPERDAFEIALLHAAERAGMPSLCICRGAQVMNVAYGGTLHQHLPDVNGLLEHGVPLDDTTAMHDVETGEGTRLAAAIAAMPSPLHCSSHHHQGIAVVGGGVSISGRSRDGLAEAIERDSSDGGWMLGVQWHPEETAATDPAQQALFDTFVGLAADHAVKA